jgi:lipid II:glycine glycyltransferase (peptidoglycan interpeptide bridge formation enzyme)
VNIREITEAEKARFDAFIADFPTGDLMQAWEWGEVKSRSGWRPVRVVGEDSEGNIIAAASILLRRIPKTGKCIAYTSRGPVIDTTDAAAFSEFAFGLRAIAAKYGAILLKIDPPVLVEDTVSPENIERAGFKLVADPTGFGGTQPKCVMQLDLDKSVDDLLASFHQKWRYNIRLAERKGVSIKSDCTKDDLRAFYDVLQVTAKRDGFLVRGYSYFETMWDLLVPSGYAKLFLGIYEGQVISGAFDFIIGNRAWYVYGASSNEHRNLMPNHLMQWTAIQWAMEQGCKWYDFRGVSPRRDASEDDDHLQGLNRFKEGFSPRYVEYIGEYDMVISPLWYWLWVRVKPAVTNMLKAKARAGSSDV